jgi:hypothetical protein
MSDPDLRLQELEQRLERVELRLERLDRVQPAAPAAAETSGRGIAEDWIRHNPVLAGLALLVVLVLVLSALFG